MRFIWSTRGREWGFRFLRTAGLDDPLFAFEEAVAHLGDERTGWCRVGDHVAIRFPDPEGRKDRAGRVIPHEFVVFEPDAGMINSIDDGCRRIWARVADEYSAIWDQPEPPVTQT